VSRSTMPPPNPPPSSSAGSEPQPASIGPHTSRTAAPGAPRPAADRWGWAPDGRSGP
jgi:hypothetical protein